MTQSTVESPNGSRPLPTVVPGSAPGLPTVSAQPAAPMRHGARAPQAPRIPASLVVAVCVAVHLLAAALVYRDLARDLYAIFEATPRLLVLEQGLTRLTAVTVFLPPVVPVTLIALTTLWLGGRRRYPDVGRSLVLSLVPLAADGVLRAIGVFLAPAPSNMGELLDLPVRFSLGPRLLLDLAGVHPSPGVAYWAVVATVPAVISAWFVGRALFAAEEAEREASARRRRRKRNRLDALEIGVAVAGTWIALAFAGQVVLPWAAQLFLKTFG